MSAERTLSPEVALVRIGGWCALAGAVVSVAAGVGFGNLTNEVGAEGVVAVIAQRPEWYWPTVHLAFIMGAVLWLGAFAAIASTLPAGISRSVGQLATVILVVGAAVHVVDSSISGFGLNAIATAWESASVQQRPELIRRAHGLLQILNGTWPSVHGLFHGVPFVLLGAAVAIGGKAPYPAWLGWVGSVGGLGSVAGAVLMFYGASLGFERSFILFAQLVSAWMIAMGVLMWRHASALGK